MESPEAPAGCPAPGQGGQQLQELGPSSLHVAITLGSCRKAWPFPNRDPHQPQRRPLLLTTPCVCSSGKPKFICQIQDTTLTVPGFSFCLSLIASGRALLKGKWCVLTGQGPLPGARKRLPRVALPSVSQAQPPYPNGKAASPGCVSVSTGHVGHTGWRGAGPRSRKRAWQAEHAVSPTIQLASPSFSRDGAPGLWAGSRAETGLRLGVGRETASERGQE